MPRPPRHARGDVGVGQVVLWLLLVACAAFLACAVTVFLPLPVSP